MADKFTPPMKCRICGGEMEAGTLTTSRQTLGADGFPFARLTSAELWYRLVTDDKNRRVIQAPAGGPLMVLHYRCVDCGYLESYAQGKYP